MFGFWNLETVVRETKENQLECSGSIYIQGRWEKLAAKNRFKWESWFGGKQHFSPRQMVMMLVFFMVSWSLQKASGVHHVVEPGFGRCRSGGACLDTCKVKRKQGQVWDICGTWQLLQQDVHLTGEQSPEARGKQATLQIWRRIMAITGQETLMWMSGLWNMSVGVGNTVSLSLTHTSSWSIPCTSLHGIKTYPRKIRRVLCIFLTVLAQSSDLMVCMQLLCNKA